MPNQKMLESLARPLPLSEKADCPQNAQLTSINKCEALTGGAENSVAEKFFSQIQDGGSSLVEKIRPAGACH
jgi:hypothetical protein